MVKRYSSGRNSITSLTPPLLSSAPYIINCAPLVHLYSTKGTHQLSSSRIPWSLVTVISPRRKHNYLDSLLFCLYILGFFLGLKYNDGRLPLFYYTDVMCQ